MLEMLKRNQKDTVSQCIRGWNKFKKIIVNYKEIKKR